MTDGYIVRDSRIPHFVTFTVVGWIDVFSREQYKEIMCKSLNFCIEKKGLRLHAWAIMANQVHMIISTGGEVTIPDFVRDCKKFTSKRIVSAIKQNEHESRKKWMLNLFAYAGRNNEEN